MIPVFHPIVIDQGSAYEITFYYTDANGSPINISNYCVTIQWRTNTGDDYFFTNKYKGTNYKLKTNSDGTIVFTIPSKTTNTYSFAGANYDLDLQEPNEDYPGSGLKTYRLVTGTVTINGRNTLVSLVDCAFSSANFNIPENCDLECSRLDLYSKQYYSTGSVSIPSTQSSIIDTINTTDTGLIDNVEVAINGLRYNNPQDLIFILAPPSGSKILLSANAKISNYAPGFSFMFSNRASPGSYINNIESGSLCLIKDKTDIITYNSEVLAASFDHLFGESINGDWSLIVINSDSNTSGTIDSWRLIVTYKAPE